MRSRIAPKIANRSGRVRWPPRPALEITVCVEGHMQAEIAIGGALISYFIAAIERKAKWVSEVVAALAVGFIALMALRYSTAEWKSVQTIFAVTAVMKPISARVAEYLSPNSEQVSRPKRVLRST